MIIDKPNELKLWLTGYLPPLCDADPEVLAKYCLALVKKDRPDEELKASLMEQLDVFLKSNTEKFVEKFLEVAKNKSYMSEPASSSPPVKNLLEDTPKSITSPSSPVSSINVPEALTGPDKPASTQSDPISLPPLPPLPPPVQPIPYPPPETTPPYPPPKKEDGTTSIKSGKSEPKDRDDRRSRRGSRSRDNKTRSRSRDRDRSRRSRSRGRSTRSKYDDRRRRSPHRTGGLKRYSRRSRSRSRSPRWSRSPVRRSRSRDRRSRSRNRSRSLSSKRHHSRHRSRSRSPKLLTHVDSSISRKSPSKEEKEGSTSPDPGTGDSTAPPLVHSVVSIPNQDRYSSSKSQRCRDYDEQGFCMRGDQCPFDHGADPVVLEGATIDFPPPLTGVPNITSVPGGVGYPLAGPNLPPGRGFLRHPPPPRPAQFGEYTPNNPGLGWGNDSIITANPYYGGRGRGMNAPPPRFPGPLPPLAPQDMGRELINVPVNGGSQGKPGIRASLAQRLGPASTNAPFSSNGTIGTGSTGVHTKYANSTENCTLELRKIPSGLNTISHLNQHFVKFGSITNIQVHHEGDPEAALITFSSHSEANAAYRSTEAVLNNRFY
ncbi:RNA-binding protein 26 [Armadillidium nasatum]|uniref:RNA-binding protein 26 n=1 Tax=Armadillidium nasatum TaxID=96803 RepID=A0A5N5STM0_9CRUS|nr:RNA-binding protein 26 [Armadillidium nasatum]